MRSLNAEEVTNVAGGEWSVTLDLVFVEGTLSGPETAQEIYAGAVDAMADFFTWWDPAGYYSSGCGGGGGW
jgi:hypothetical protein